MGEGQKGVDKAMRQETEAGKIISMKEPRHPSAALFRLHKTNITPSFAPALCHYLWLFNVPLFGAFEKCARSVCKWVCSFMCGRMSFQFIFCPYEFFIANSILFIYDYTTIDSFFPSFCFFYIEYHYTDRRFGQTHLINIWHMLEIIYIVGFMPHNLKYFY